MIRALSFISLILGVVALARPARNDVAATYRITLNGKAIDGALWLYHYSWYGLEKYKLDDVREGVAHVALTPKILAERVRPHQNIEAFLVALDVPGSGWFRSADIEPGALLTNLLSAIDALGAVREQSGTRILALTPPVRRTLQLVSPDGTPHAGVELGIETFVYNRNHCGAHSGFGDMRKFRTDSTGRVTFTAPLAPMYLPIKRYVAGSGPWGETRTLEYGLAISAAAKQTISVILDPGPEENFVVRVRRSDGQPASGVKLMMAMRANVCGATWGPVGLSNGRGEIRAAMSAANVERLWLQLSERDDDKRALSDEDVRALFKNHELLVTLPADKPPKKALTPSRDASDALPVSKIGE